MTAERTTYSGWNEYPIYLVRKYKDYRIVVEWMRQHECDEFLLSSGPEGYTFQVRQNHDWFVLRWV